MDTSKSSDERPLRAQSLKLVGWAWHRRCFFAVLLLVSTVTIILGPWRLTAWPLQVRALASTTTSTLASTHPLKHAPTQTPTPRSKPTSKPKPKTLSADQKALALRRCLGGVVTVQKGGRFGNCFMEWASAWALTRIHNLTLALPTDLQDTLHRAFSHVPMGPTVAALLRDCPFGEGLSEKDALKNTFNREDVPQRAAAFAAAVANATDAAPAPGPLALPMYVVSPSITECVEELRAQVRWRPELRDGAQATLQRVAKATADKFGGSPNDVVLVGVHARRTDYHAWIKKRLHVKVEADAHYYARALLRLARTLEETAYVKFGRPVAMHPLAAVVASDDMDWVRRVLLPALDNMAGTSALKMATFASGGGTEKSTLPDLALLSACNHTVISYGTYGMTAALLAGGHVVAYDLNSTYPSSQFAKLLPRWIIMR